MNETTEREEAQTGSGSRHDRMVIAGWVDPKERTPVIIPAGSDTTCGTSDDVLTCYLHFDDAGEIVAAEYYVDRYHRGGKGDCKTEYWGIDDSQAPDYWKPIIGPIG